MDILNEIVETHKKDISQKGIQLGFEIPAERTRPIVPFLPSKGVILEVKRASPSKGDIAPNLDSAATALSYVDAGAAAISVLTEEHWFKGTLNDLKKVANAVGTKAAVLRKDFLVEEEEIEVAYKCGADAVLLIARILDDEKIISMAKKSQSLGITSLVELKMDDDLRKLALVAKAVDSSSIVCGVNCRDLKNFSIDLLTPSTVIDEIRKILGKDARVVFESGIRTPQAAGFAGSLGFTGMLLGEAAARNPKEANHLVSNFVNATETLNSKFWKDFALKIKEKNLGNSKKPFVKICGITNEEDAESAATNGANFLGFIFSSKSPRKVTYDSFAKIKGKIDSIKSSFGIKAVGVITDISSEESNAALSFLEEGTIDVIQVHGFEAAKEFLADNKLRCLPHYCAVPVRCEEDLSMLEELRKLGEPRILVDSKVEGMIGGTGKQIDGDLIKKISAKQKLWLAGGLNPCNIKSAVQNYGPELVDVSSGLEIEPGKKDLEKVAALFQNL